MTSQPTFDETMLKWSKEEFAKNAISTEEVALIPGGDFKGLDITVPASLFIYGGQVLSYIQLTFSGTRFGFWFPMSLTTGGSIGLLSHVSGFKITDVLYVTITVVNGSIYIALANKQREQIAFYCGTWPGAVTDSFTISALI